MAPIIEKRVIQQQPPIERSPMTASAIKESSNAANGAGLTTSATLGAAQTFVQNALNHSHGHGHGQHHHHHHHTHNHNSHHHHHYQHAKENATNNTTSTNNHLSVSSMTNKKGLEILDFHESWREEVEMYKDVMYVKKHIPQQLLASHNHVHTTQGCQLEMSNNNVDANKFSHVTKPHNNNIVNSIASQSSPALVAGQTNGGIAVNGVGGANAASNAKRNLSNENKSRVRVAATALLEGPGESIVNNQRPREELPSKTASGAKYSSPRNAKRTGHSSSPIPDNHHQVANNNSPTKNITVAAASNKNNNLNIAPNTISITSNLTATSPAKNNLKIIVNQFHASSLLNGHQYEEKEKILTQNGLTDTQSSSATAYEASFYASNYLTPEARNQNNNNNSQMHGMMKTDLCDNSNYVGVSLANNVNGDTSAHLNGNPLADDDPCAAIDDVNTCTDSDSEDEYIGDPFYLAEDKNETKQSKHIHLHSHGLEVNNDVSSNNESNVYYTPQCILSASLFPNVPPYLNFSSHAQSGPDMPPQLHKILKWKLSPVMPKIVKRVVLNSGFRIIKNTTDWMAVWEKHMKSPGFRTIRSHQKYNHMPGSFRIGRKDSMWRSIQQNMKKFGNKEFGFMQRSFVMPDDLEDLRKSWPKSASRQTRWIVKPPASARGTGISIVNKWSQFPKDRPLVVQKYIEHPLLINDNKFDMRIYVVMTSVNPLRIYMYKDGLARFASVKYSSERSNLDERCMHLTNYSINKFSENYAKNEDINACQGHKWTLQSLWCCLEERGVNTKRLWATLRNLVIRAIISGEAGLNRTYRQNVNFRYNCFELFGFDVLLDENLIPWLLEINISPSLHSELPLDLHIKGPLIQAILNTALYQVPPKLNEKNQKEILETLKLKGPLCHDKRIFTTGLRNDEIRKHNHFTNRSIEYREEYLEAILDNLNPDDVRCLLVSEDELNRCSPLERIFPTCDTYKYLQFVEHPRYYNRLLDAWENRYSNCRENGIELLRSYCQENYHVIVSDAALEKEPKVDLTEIDMLHVKKAEDPAADDTSVPLTADIDDISNTPAKESSQPANTNNDSSNTNATENYDFNSLNDFQNESKYNKSKQNCTTTNTNPNKIKTNTNESTGKPKTEIKVS